MGSASLSELDLRASAGIPPALHRVSELAWQWQQAAPFSHVVLDDFLAPAALSNLRHAVALERHNFESTDISEVWSSASALSQPTLRAFAAMLGCEAVRSLLLGLTGCQTQRLELRSHLFLPGCYLLPHLDDPQELGRRIGCAFYVSRDDSFVGGELNLYAARVEQDQIVDAVRARTIQACANRLVLFEVSKRALHEVREVTGGVRASLSGWYYRD